MDETRSLENIVSYLPEMLSGEELKSSLEYLPLYDKTVRMESSAVKLMALNSLYDIYIPNIMSTEIYSKIYLATLRSLKKKGTKLAVQQKNLNGKKVQGCVNVGSSVINGADSFTIIGSSGIGKSSSIARAIQTVGGNRIIEIEEPFCKIIPCIMIQCPFDCSVKSMLLSILKQIDNAIDTHYYDMAIKAKATTDMLIGSVSQVCLNHIGLLIIDEIQNIVKNKHGMHLIGMLTMLINHSGISICMVGTPEAEVFFEQIDYLSRRALGLNYGKSEYDETFYHLCNVLFSYQYVQERTELNEGMLNWLYEHSGGTAALLVTLIHDAQEIAILNGYEKLNLTSLTMAYEERMGMMHNHIQPSVNVMKRSVLKERDSIQTILEKSGIKEEKQNSVLEGETEFVFHPCNKSVDAFNLVELAEDAKKNGLDMIDLLKGKISITEVLI